jgi:DNA-directed RNA polymerase subunit RPC12/RpoP
MSKKITYRCEACGKTVEIVDGEMNMPECCQRAMTKDDGLDFCEKPSDPEHARLFDDDEPCDDGRTGKI